MFLDPASDDPEQHIGFREEYPYAIGRSARGEATWRALGLEREALAEMRRQHLETVKVLRAVRDGKGPAPLRVEAKRLLRKMAGARGEWSSMVRCALAGPST